MLMNELLKLRNYAIWVYKKYEPAAEMLLKMLGGAILFAAATAYLPFGRISMVKLFVMIAGAATAIVATPAVMLILAWLLLSVSVLAVSVEAGVFVFIVFFMLYLFYGRICPKESLLFAAMLVLYKFGMAYVIPVAAAIYMGPAAIIPVCLAVFVHSYSPMLEGLISAYPLSAFSVGDIMDTFAGAAQYVIENFSSSSGWIVLCGTVAVSMVAVWFMSTSFVKNEKEKAVLAGGVILIIGGLASVMFSSVYYGSMGLAGYVISVVIGCIAAYIATLFECVKDYGHTEKVVFQDNEYVYYVKAVPKVENIGARVRRRARTKESAFEKMVPEGAKNVLKFGSTEKADRTNDYK